MFRQFINWESDLVPYKFLRLEFYEVLTQLLQCHNRKFRPGGKSSLTVQTEKRSDEKDDRTYNWLHWKCETPSIYTVLPHIAHSSCPTASHHPLHMCTTFSPLLTKHSLIVDVNMVKVFYSRASRSGCDWPSRPIGHITRNCMELPWLPLELGTARYGRSGINFRSDLEIWWDLDKRFE